MLSRDHRQYFAYGENMHPEVMAARCAGAEVLGIGRLDGFRLGFFNHSGRWDGALESVVQEPGSTVFGVLYRLEFGEGETLDDYLDARLDGLGSHFHYPVDVILEDGSCTDALIYMMSDMGPARAPSAEYLGFLAEAARLNGLPGPYIEQLSAHASRPARYPVPRIGQGPAAGGCDGCGDWRDELRERA
jgi:cation transport regulator ChaC